MKTAPFFRLVLLLVALVAGTAAVRAEDLNAVKSRMTQRVGTLTALKDRQVAGENNQGYLEQRGNATPADQKLIADENADRRVVYAALAAQTGATADAVGRQRAQQLAALAKPGVWIQGVGGDWKKKS